MCSQKKNKLEYRIRCVWQRKFHRKLVTNWPIHNLSIHEGNQTLWAILYDDNQDPGFNKKKKKKKKKIEKKRWLYDRFVDNTFYNSTHGHGKQQV